MAIVQIELGRFPRLIENLIAIYTPTEQEFIQELKDRGCLKLTKTPTISRIIAVAQNGGRLERDNFTGVNPRGKRVVWEDSDIYVNWGIDMPDRPDWRLLFCKQRIAKANGFLMRVVEKLPQLGPYNSPDPDEILDSIL